MENMERIFKGVANTAKEELRRMSSKELVKLSREGNDVAVAILATRVLPMSKTVAHSKNCFGYGQAEVCESFQHALMYAINKFDVDSATAKFETFYKWCADSTYAQMHQTANTGKNKQMNTAESIDDLQFAIPDEHHESMEETMMLDNLANLIIASNWAPEDLQIAYRDAIQRLDNKKDDILADESIDDDTIEKRFAAINDAIQKCTDKYNNISKLHRARMVKLIKAAADSVHTLSEEELCIELRLFKSKENSKESQSELLRKYAELVKEVGRSEINKGLLSRYGIICDKKRLQVVQKDLKSFLTYIDFIDVDSYQLMHDKAVLEEELNKAIEKVLVAEAKARGKKPAEMREAYKTGNFILDIKSIAESVKEKFIHSHPDTLVAEMAV